MLSLPNHDMEFPERTLLARLEAFRRSDADRDRMVEQVGQAPDLVSFRVWRTSLILCSLSKTIQTFWRSTGKSVVTVRTRSNLDACGRRKLAGSNAFAVVVIDGDDLPFRDSLYTKGKDGGAEAARLLHDELKEQLKRFHPNEDITRWDIYVTVFLNVQGSASTPQSCSLVSDSAECVAFGRAFNNAQPLFQIKFTNIEGEVERTGYSARETLRSFLPITQCKHDHPVNSRLTLIEGKPAVPAFANLGFNRIQIPAVFGSDDVSTRLGTFGVDGSRRISSFDNLLLCSPSSSRKASASFVQPAISVPSPRPTGQSSSKLEISEDLLVSQGWTRSVSDLSALGEGGESKVKRSASSAAAAQKFVYLNAHGHRLDVALPACNQLAQFRLSEQIKKHGKLCNDYHLTGQCNREWCEYRHGDPLTKRERLVLRHIARSLPCPNKSCCREPDCYRGHQCQFGSGCTLTVCRLKETHDIDPVSEIQTKAKLYRDTDALLQEPATKLCEDGAEESLLALDENNVSQSVS
nr:hypothetical protein CFP56_11453 [Quercus suber]